MASLTAAALLFTGLLLVATVGAQPGAWERDARTLSFQSQADGFQFTSLGRGMPEDRITGDFDAASGGFALGFSRQDPGDPADIHLEAAWTALVEYRDVDRDGAYGLQDEAIRRIEVSSLDGAVVAAPLVGGGHSATVTYAIPANESDEGPLPVDDGLPTPHGRMQIAFLVVPEPATAGGKALLPTQVATTVTVERFPYQEPDTRLAVEMALTTAAGSTLQPVPDGLGVGRGAFEAAFAVDPAAAFGAGSVPVQQSHLSTGEQAATLLYSLPRGDSVQHGGAFSVQHLGTEALREFVKDPPGNPVAYAAGLAATAAILGTASIRRLRGP